MPTFNAASVVEELDYDFTRFGGQKSKIPEPSKDKIVAYYNDLDELLKQVAGEHVKLPDKPTAQDLIEAVNLLTMAESYGPMLDGMTLICSALCSNSPSVEELEQLPPRIRGLFFQWLGEQLRPELNAVDSKPALRPVRIAQGG